MGLEKPVQRKKKGKAKKLARGLDERELEERARRATYDPSPYHSRGANGAPVKIRAEPTSVCQKKWSLEEAHDALRRAIRNCWVSEVWENGFPRHVWYRVGEDVYEARHTNGPSGTYHAYPIDVVEAPPGFIQ